MALVGLVAGRPYMTLDHPRNVPQPTVAYGSRQQVHEAARAVEGIQCAHGKGIFFFSSARTVLCGHKMQKAKRGIFLQLSPLFSTAYRYSSPPTVICIPFPNPQSSVHKPIGPGRRRLAALSACAA